MSYLCGVLVNYNTMLTVDNLVYSYPRSSHRAIDGMTLSLKPGAIYGLLGANGTGKSTLLYLMSGLLKPASGSAELDGISTFERRPETLADIFLVSEEFELPSIELAEFVRLNAPFYPNFSQEQMMEYLEHFRLSGDIHLGRLSMGQKKKAFIAFALACNTKILLMDEPTNGLDIPGKVEFRRAVVSAMNDDRAIVISTHQVRDLDRVLDHVVMIDNHGVVLNSSISDIQRKLRFILTADPAEIQGSLWNAPTIGGYSVIKFRTDEAPETDVNLESLFEFAFANPEIIKGL